MARLNLLNLNSGTRTHEDAPARNISTELQPRLVRVGFVPEIEGAKVEA